MKQKNTTLKENTSWGTTWNHVSTAFCTQAPPLRDDFFGPATAPVWSILFEGCPQNVLTFYQSKQCITIGKSHKNIIHLYCLVPPMWVVWWPLFFLQSCHFLYHHQLPKVSYGPVTSFCGWPATCNDKGQCPSTMELEVASTMSLLEMFHAASTEIAPLNPVEYLSLNGRTEQ